jgi:magnesium chelatase accessory protein
LSTVSDVSDHLREDALDWNVEGVDWPNRAQSRFVDEGRLRWHVQVAGTGPVLLLVHGTGASAHSFRDLLPRLATRFTVLAPDLPGHAFTRGATEAELSLPGMAHALAQLVARLGLPPVLAVGHSAGAAVLAQAVLDRSILPARLVGLNAALLPLQGIAGHLFLPAARLLAGNPLVPRLFAWHATGQALATSLLRGTGSVIDARGVDLYARLLRSTDHVEGVLRMMANWDVGELAERLPDLGCPLTLLVGTADRTVDPEQAERVRALLPGADVHRLQGLGHLAHEERPAQVADWLIDRARAAGILVAD